MSGHALLVEQGDDHFEDQPDWKGTIHCLTPAKCEGWWECSGDHTGYDPDEKDSPAYDQTEDVMIHGVLHGYQHGFGWTVPYDGCIVAASDSIHEHVYEIGQQHGAGLHLVDTEWEDTDCTLIYVTVDDIRQAGRRSAKYGVGYQLAEAECKAKCPEGTWGDLNVPFDRDLHDHRQTHHESVEWATAAVAEHVKAVS